MLLQKIEYLILSLRLFIQPQQRIYWQNFQRPQIDIQIILSLIITKNFHYLKISYWTQQLNYGWGSTASRLESLRGGSLPFTTKFPDIPGTHFTDLRWKDERRSRPWGHPVVLNTGTLDWESSTLTTRPLPPLLPFRKTSTGQNASSFIGPELWNKIPEEIKRTTNLNTFKHNVKKHTKKNLESQIFNKNYCY